MVVVRGGLGVRAEGSTTLGIPNGGTCPSRPDPNLTQRSAMVLGGCCMEVLLLRGRGGKALDRRAAFLPDGDNKHFPT